MELFRIPVAQLLLPVLAATVVLAVVGYRLVERPAIALGHRLTGAPRPAPAPLQSRREQLAGVSSGPEG
jgi:peptidoglycan/LPS O-acetylase OafA/YrhL